MNWIHSISIDGSIAEALQRLRDIHAPATPGWWPLPIGWWIAAGLVLAIISVLFWLVVVERKKRAPYMAIRKNARRLIKIRNDGLIDAKEYATRTNLLFKELVIRVEGQWEAASLHGSTWLEFLAERFDEREFVDGAGQCLGSTRYMADPISDAGLQDLVHKTLLKTSPLNVSSDA